MSDHPTETQPDNTTPPPTSEAKTEEVLLTEAPVGEAKTDETETAVSSVATEAASVAEAALPATVVETAPVELKVALPVVLVERTPTEAPSTQSKSNEGRALIGKASTSQCIVVTSGKGGVGKTTTSANLGCGLALAGKRVALVDADIGLRNLDLILGLENRIVYDLVQVIEGECKLKQALIRDKRIEGLYMLPAAQTRDKNAVKPDDMRRLINDLKETFDYVIVDCPAGIEQGFKNSIAGADRAIIVTTPEVSAIRDADRIIGLVEANELPEPELIINRYRSGMVKRGDMMNKDDILEILAISLIGIVPDHEDVIVSANRGTPAVFDERSMVGAAYRRIAARVMGEQIAIPSFEEADGSGFWTTFKRWMGMAPGREVV